MAIHLGIIGGGGISESHARAAREIPNLRIAAFYGQNQARVERLAQDFGARAYNEYDSFLNHHPLDLVAIGSPSGLHADQGIAAARRGLHVLTEKPLDISLVRADALIEECERAGVKLGLFFQDRTATDLRRLKDLIDGGILGRPTLVSARVKWYRAPEYYNSSRWRGTLALDGGGALINQGVHTVDLLLWLLGDVLRISAYTATALHSIEAEDTCVATLEFANGAVGTLEATTAAYPGFPRRVEISGTEGTIVVEHDRVIGVHLQSGATRDELFSSAEENSNASSKSAIVSDVRGHRKIFEDFLRAIKENTRPLCDGREGRRSLELVVAVYRSARGRHNVNLKP
ncbi:MAG: Gfo/Idh/MocA family oxidoreductase [Pyrinomonadaceae bacterium]